MSKIFDKAAIASDTSRSVKQYLARQFSRAFVSATGLNRAGFLATEIVQAIQPVKKIKTKHGVMLCSCGHGRLLWRAETFHSEEPETIEWLDRLTPSDVLWDIGANVGMYSVYAARFRKCSVVAFEPESQNFAILVRNIALNGVQKLCRPANIAASDKSAIGKLHVRYVTQGGAYNSFDNSESQASGIPESNKGIWQSDEINPVTQMMFGMSLDDLVFKHALAPPSHIKIDVDGIEPLIIDGSDRVLSLPTLKSVLIEVNRNSPRDLAIPKILASKGFFLASERSNWLSRDNRQREEEMPTTNMIFNRT